MEQRIISQKIVQMFLLLILAMGLFTGKASAQTDPVDQEVLASFYSSLVGNLTWNTTNDACETGGGWLTCTGPSTDLKASSINLAAGGTIPSSLGSLTQLVSLKLTPYISGSTIDQFSGTIPSQLGLLSNLQFLLLDGNLLTGTIPTQLLSLTDLQQLDLSSNQLSGTIPQFSSLSSLTLLNLSTNCFWSVANYSSWASTNDYASYTSNPACTCLGGQIVPTGCSCFSGFTGSNCTVNQATGTLPSVSALTTEPVAEFQLSQSFIANGTFNFVVTSPSRNLRYFQWIDLLGNSSIAATSSCGYPGTIVTKSFNSTGSFDIFQGAISLSNVVSSCQFQQTSTPGQQSLTGILSVSAVDPIGQFRGVTIQRTTTSNLVVVLTIPTQVNVTSTSLEVSSPIDLLAAITEQSFDATIPLATIVITTSLQWPYALVNSSLISTPSTITASPASVVSFSLNISSCSNATDGSTCVQTAVLTISGACQFSGLFSIDWNYGCRASSQECLLLGLTTNTSTLGTNITLVSDSGCSVIEIDSQLEGTLTTYADSGFTTSSVTFMAGNPIYFKAHLTASVNILSVSVTTLTATNQTGTTVLVSGGSPLLASINFNPSVGTPASSDTQFSFVYSYGSGPDYLSQTGSEQVQTITVEATVQVSYTTTFGRRRRDVLQESMALKASFVAYRMN